MANTKAQVILEMHADITTATTARNRIIESYACKDEGLLALREVFNSQDTPYSLKQYIYQNYMGKVTLDDL